MKGLKASIHQYINASSKLSFENLLNNRFKMRKFQLQQNESKRGLLILGDLGLHIFSSFFPLRVKKSYIFS